MLSLAEQLRSIADSGYPEKEENYERFKQNVARNKERKLLLAFAEAANEGHCHLNMGNSHAPVELINQGIRFTVTDRGMIAYW